MWKYTRIATALILTGLLAACAAQPTPSITPDGKLPPCPSSPNCLSSQAEDARHACPPIPAKGARTDVMRRLKLAISSMPGCEITKVDETSIHAVFTSSFFGFKDDVLCIIDEEEHVIHIRSASRIGYWDFGANRKRVKALRERFLNQPEEMATP